jgi:hypothetical protein
LIFANRVGSGVDSDPDREAKTEEMSPSFLLTAFDVKRLIEPIGPTLLVKLLATEPPLVARLVMFVVQ